MKSIKKFIMDHIDAFVAGAMAILFLVAIIVWCMRGCIIFSLFSTVAFIFFICIAVYKYRKS